MIASVQTVDVRRLLRDFIESNFFSSSESFGDEDSLFEKGIVDSTGVLEVVAFVEEKFGIKVKDDELVPENFETVAKLVRFVETRRSLTTI